MIIRILILSCLICISNESFTQNIKTSNILKLKVKLDSIEKIITINRWGTDSTLYAHYSLKNTSIDTIVFVTNSCPSLNIYSMKINDSLSIFNLNVNCTINAFIFDTISPAESIQVSDLLLNNSEIKFNNTQILTFYIPLVEWENGEVQVNGSANVSNNIFFTGKSKFITKYVDNKKKKTPNKD